MSKKILFRADSSSQIGLGHIMRDLVLAKQFKDDEVMFACQDLAGNIMYKIPFTIKILHTSKVDELIEVIIEESIDMLVIDNYDIGYEDEKKIKEETGVKIFVFDDTYEKHHCDVLLNHNIYAQKEKYKNLVPNDCTLKCGEEFLLLREEFYVESGIDSEKVYDYFVAMGGADTENLTISILKKIKQDKKVAVVTTKANKNLVKLQLFVKNNSNIQLFVDFDNIAKIINRSKFAIITPSVTSNELYFMKVPFMAIKTAENQAFMCEFLKKRDYIVLEKNEIKRINFEE